MGKNTIKLKKYLDINKEFLAGGTITPGMLLKLGSGGTVTAHGAEGGTVAPVMFALEDELQGKEITDTYASTDPVQCWICVPGEEVYAILADNNDIDIGDLLQSKGDGTLEEYEGSDSAANDESIVGMALEAVDTTGSPSATTSRLKIMVV